MDPAAATILSSAITGVVSAVAAYMQYRVGMQQAEHKTEALPEKPNEQTLQQGEQALAVVQEAVANHGTKDEQIDLTNFERNPQRYEKQLAQVLGDIAAREPAFAERILTLVPQADNDSSRGTVTLNESIVTGVVGGVITGDITQGDISG